MMGRQVHPAALLRLGVRTLCPEGRFRESKQRVGVFSRVKLTVMPLVGSRLAEICAAPWLLKRSPLVMRGQFDRR